MTAGSQSSPVPSPRRVVGTCEDDGMLKSTERSTRTAFDIVIFLRSLRRQDLRDDDTRRQPMTAAQNILWDPQYRYGRRLRCRYEMPARLRGFLPSGSRLLLARGFPPCQSPVASEDDVSNQFGIARIGGRL